MERVQIMSRIPLVMFYTDNMKKEKQIVSLCRKLNLQIRRMKKTDGEKSVGQLAGLPGTVLTVGQSASKERMPQDFVLPEFLIFSGLHEEQLDSFLGEYRQAGIEPIALKAVVTQHNKDWSLYALCRELMREHVAMTIQTGK